MNFHAVYAKYRKQLKNVESLLGERSRTDQIDLSRASAQLLEAGGKRIRPLFALICGTAGANGAASQDDVAKVAAALEMTHMATLVHDDVIDHANLRRGKPTVRSEFGNLAAMYTGDYLFARAIQLLAEVDNPSVHKAMSAGLVRLVQGEIDQIQDFFHWNQSVKTYLRRIERKTALLMSLSCTLGAAVGGADDNEVRALGLYGHMTGMAFQIIDDILDFTGSPEVIGKPVGGDLRQGNITLPALLCASLPQYGPRLRQIVRQGLNDGEVREAIDIVIASGGMERARDIADRYIDKAIRVLMRVQRKEVRQHLQVLTTFVAERSF